MDVVLKSPTPHCAVSGTAFTPGDRVLSLLLRLPGGDYGRIDALEAHAAGLQATGEVLCRWTRTFKPKAPDADAAEKELRQSLEGIFLGLYAEGREPAPEEHDLVRFLALFLERRRLLRPARGRAPAGWTLFEHTKLKQVFRVPAAELDVAFFQRMQEKFATLIGGPAQPA